MENVYSACRDKSHCSVQSRGTATAWLMWRLRLVLTPLGKQVALTGTWNALFGHNGSIYVTNHQPVTVSCTQRAPRGQNTACVQRASSSSRCEGKKHTGEWEIKDEWLPPLQLWRRYDVWIWARKAAEVGLKFVEKNKTHTHTECENIRVILPPNACFITKFMMMAFNSLPSLSERCYIHLWRKSRSPL